MNALRRQDSTQAPVCSSLIQNEHISNIIHAHKKRKMKKTTAGKRSQLWTRQTRHQPAQQPFSSPCAPPPLHKRNETDQILTFVLRQPKGNKCKNFLSDFFHSLPCLGQSKTHAASAATASTASSPALLLRSPAAKSSK